MIISRIDTYVDSLRTYKIIIDKQVVGKIKNGKTLELDLDDFTGIKTIYLKIDWCRSNKIKIDNDDRNTRLLCGPSMMGRNIWIPFLAFYYITFGYYKYLWLKKR
ncbi:MAG: hypothetical protein WC219_06105 [Acholeplasmataceae bacterium]